MKDFFTSIKIKKSYIVTIALLLIAVVICVATVNLSPKSPTIDGGAVPVAGYDVDDEVEDETTEPPTEAPTEPPEPDTEAPIFVTGSVVSVKVGSERVPEAMICIDNIDRSVVQTVEGDYDLNTLGEYNVVRVAVDRAGNRTEFPFKLRVVEEVPKSSEEPLGPKVNISDLIAAHKTDKTSIGIDVSKWQGDIDWQKVKNAGVEFVMIRLGVQDGFFGEQTVDSHFLQNYEGAKAAGLKVGVYYYSYAASADEMKAQAEFVVATLKENSCKLDLPVAYDWESWSRLNSLGLNLNEFNDMARIFIDTVRKGGYDGMLYSSKYYLEKTLWRLPADKYPVWLAHYTNKTPTTYEGEYSMWQCSCTGVVPGINGGVDVNVLYNG